MMIVIITFLALWTTLIIANAVYEIRRDWKIYSTTNK